MTPPGISIFEMYLIDGVRTRIFKGYSKKPVLIKERLKHDDFISWIKEPHESTEHAFIGPAGNDNFVDWVNLPTEKRRICVCNCFLQPRSSLNRVFLFQKCHN